MKKLVEQAHCCADEQEVEDSFGVLAAESTPAHAPWRKRTRTPRASKRRDGGAERPEDSTTRMCVEEERADEQEHLPRTCDQLPVATDGATRQRALFLSALALALLVAGTTLCLWVIVRGLGLASTFARATSPHASPLLQVALPPQPLQPALPRHAPSAPSAAPGVAARRALPPPHLLTARQKPPSPLLPPLPSPLLPPLPSPLLPPLPPSPLSPSSPCSPPPPPPMHPLEPSGAWFALRSAKCASIVHQPSHKFHHLWGREAWVNRGMLGNVQPCWGANPVRFFDSLLQAAQCNRNWHEGTGGSARWDRPRYTAPAPALLGFDPSIWDYCTQLHDPGSWADADWNAELVRRCVGANQNILRMMVGYNMCANLQWVMCVALHFATLFLYDARAACWRASCTPHAHAHEHEHEGLRPLDAQWPQLWCARPLARTAFIQDALCPCTTRS